MSTVNQTTNTGQQAITNYDLSKIFLLNNRYATGTYTNSSGGSVTIVAGTVIGRISASGLLLPLVAAASDNSQFPVGISASAVTVANGASVTLTYCIAGDVAEEAVVFQNGTDTLNTVVSGRRLRDRIAADTVGIILKFSNDLTAFDNQ